MSGKWAVLALVALGTFMTTLDASIVNISLPSIARMFHTPIDGAVEWVIIAYLVVIAATLLTFGRLSDLVGRKPIWMAGLAVFTLGSICCGAAASLPQLVVARAFQGLGGALIFAPSFAIITDAFAAVGLALLTMSLSFGQEWGWTSPRLLTCLAVALVVLAALPLIERRVREPIIDLALLRRRVFASALGSLTLAMLALFGISFMLPFYFEELRGFSVEKSGLLLTPLPLTIAVVAPLSGALADRIGSRWLASGGLAVACLGLLLLAGLDATSTIGDIVWRLILTGVGQGFFQSPNTRALMNAAPGGTEGEASGLLTTGRVVGQSLSVALAGAIFAGLGGASAGRALAATRTGSVDSESIAALQRTFLTGFKSALMVCAAVAAAGVLAALIRGNEQRPASGD